VTETRPAAAAPFELRARVVSSVVLIAAILAALFSWTWIFAAAITTAAIIALREWHRLVNGNLDARETIPSAIAVTTSVLLLMQSLYVPAFDAFDIYLPAYWPFLVLFLGAGVTAISAGLRRAWVLWHGVGVIYIGIPALALIMLHIRGPQLVGGIFVAVWAADTAALFVGRMVGGPRLAPRLSPNKTWAGFVGGLIAASIAETIYMPLAAGDFGAGASAYAVFAIFGLFLGFMAALGDLFESWAKRQFRAKNTGNLIPGHGGMLDRIDSLLFAAPAAAVLFFLGEVL
jgi:phosphatidate cytidylyltransferase